MLVASDAENPAGKVIRRYAGLLRGWNEARDLTERRLQDNGIPTSPTEIVILHALLSSEELSLRLTEICEITGYSRSAMALTVGNLTRQRYTATTGGGRTGTPILVLLTAEGSTYIEGLCASFVQEHQRLAEDARMSPSGRGVISEMLYTPSVLAVETLPEGSFARQYLDVEHSESSRHQP